MNNFANKITDQSHSISRRLKNEREKFDQEDPRNLTAHMNTMTINQQSSNYDSGYDNTPMPSKNIIDEKPRVQKNDQKHHLFPKRSPSKGLNSRGDQAQFISDPEILI